MSTQTLIDQAIVALQAAQDALDRLSTVDMAALQTHADAPQLWRSLVTGSRAYGTPRKDSDIDLVVCVSPDDLALLKDTAEEVEFTKAAPSQGHSDGDGEISSASFRFGRLNLIACTLDDDFGVWWHGTQFLKTKAPVSRERATAYLRKQRAKAKNDP